MTGPRPGLAIGGGLSPEYAFHEAPPTPQYVPTVAPWEQPPPGAIDFLAQSRATVTGLAGADVTQVLAQLITPEHMVGVVRELSYQINDVVSSTNVNFAFRVNQGPVQGYRLDVFPKVASHDLIEFDPNVTMIRVPKASDLDVLVTVRAGDIGTYLVGAVFKGWWYPEELDSLYIEARRQGYR